MRDFEKNAIRQMAARVIPAEILDRVLSAPERVDYLYTGCGYYLDIFHRELPVEGGGLYEPLVTGVGSGVEAGFVVYLGNHKLTLECHPFAVDVPANFREGEVRVSST